jgi:hypothetical protein
MREANEIEQKLERLLKVQEAHSHKPEKCPTCGHEREILDSWILSDSAYIMGEIDALKWALAQLENLTEDHT